MAETDIETTLRQMLIYATAAQNFVVGRTRADLDEDFQLELALTRAIEVAGEAARRLPPDFVAAHQDAPFRAMIAMRNFLAHGYDLIDLDMIWRTVHEDLPDLIAEREAILSGDTE